MPVALARSPSLLTIDEVQSLRLPVVRASDFTPHSTFTDCSQTSVQSHTKKPRLHEPSSTEPARALSSFQVCCMLFSAIVGVGFFQNGSYAVSVAGPAGLLVGLAITAFVAICVMECVCEMTVLFPTSNAMVQFVRHFVDEDLAVIVGVGYWFAQCIIFASLITSSINLISLWTSNPVILISISVLIPGVLTIINLDRVRIFGYMQTAFGMIKISLIVVSIILMSVAASRLPRGEVQKNLSDGFELKEPVALNAGAALLFTIPLGVYQFVGLESMTTLSFETYRPTEELKVAVKYLPGIAPLYLLLALLFGMTVSHSDSRLTTFSNQIMGGAVPMPVDAGVVSHFDGVQNISAPIIANVLGGINPSSMNAIFVFCSISSANMALYIASRSLFGMARTLDREQQWLPYQIIAYFGCVERRTQVPRTSVLISAAIFSWLPIAIATMDAADTKFQVAQALLNIACLNCVLVWAALCRAFMNYDSLRRKYGGRLEGKLARFRDLQSKSFLSRWQPWISYFGLAGCVLILFIILMVLIRVGIVGDRGYEAQVTGAVLSPSLALIAWAVIKGFRRFSSKPSLLYMRKINFEDFKSRLRILDDNVNPSEYPAQSTSVSQEGDAQDLRLRGNTYTPRIITITSSRTTSLNGSMPAAKPGSLEAEKKAAQEKFNRSGSDNPPLPYNV